MFKWWKNLVVAYKVVKRQEEVDKKLDTIPERTYNISEPVWSIVKSFGEKGRWRVETDFKPLTDFKSSPAFRATDAKTGESIVFTSESYYCSHSHVVIPKTINRYYLPSWMTDEEKRYVQDDVCKRMGKINERFERVKDRYRKASDAQHEINKSKERQRLMKVYCKED